MRKKSRGGIAGAVIDWRKFDRLLGLDRDSAVAARIGCTLQAVQQRRKKLGIPSHDAVAALLAAGFTVARGK